MRIILLGTQIVCVSDAGYSRILRGRDTPPGTSMSKSMSRRERDRWGDKWIDGTQTVSRKSPDSLHSYAGIKERFASLCSQLRSW